MPLPCSWAIRWKIRSAAGALDADGDARIFCLEHLSPRRSAVLSSSAEEKEILPSFRAASMRAGVHRGRRRGRGPERFGEQHAGRRCRRRREKIAPRPFPVLHGRLLVIARPLPARRSDAKLKRRWAPPPMMQCMIARIGSGLQCDRAARSNDAAFTAGRNRRWPNGSVLSRRKDRLRHAGRRQHRGSHRRHVRRRQAERREAETLRRSDHDAVRAFEDDLPVE